VILVDTSVWINFLRGQMPQRPGEDELLLFSTCGPIIQEVMQGLTDTPRRASFRDSLLALPRFADPIPADLYLEAAEIFRDGRRRGYTIRSSIDCLIAAIAIRHQVPVWHSDRDFDVIAKYTRLSIYQRRLAHA
jgi:predicted nucleic acid-binding protein